MKKLSQHIEKRIDNKGKKVLDINVSGISESISLQLFEQEEEKACVVQKVPINSKKILKGDIEKRIKEKQIIEKSRALKIIKPKNFKIEVLNKNVEEQMHKVEEKVLTTDFEKLSKSPSLEIKSKIQKMLYISEKDCLFCYRKDNEQNIIKKTLNKKYLTTRESYNAKVISDIIFNENTHLVARFKEYLIYDDISEFLKRSYVLRGSKERLPKIFDYYSKYSKVFPNYVVVQEKQYMFKNIARKQRAIDDHQKNEARQEKRRVANLLGDVRDNSLRIFTLTMLRELNKSNAIYNKSIHDSISKEGNTLLQSYTKLQPSTGADTSNVFEMNLEQLLGKFMIKDSLSFIDLKNLNEKQTEPTIKLIDQKGIMANTTGKRETPSELEEVHQIKKSLDLSEKPGLTIRINSSKKPDSGHKRSNSSSSKMRDSQISHATPTAKPTRTNSFRNKNGVNSKRLYSNEKGQNQTPSSVRPDYPPKTARHTNFQAERVASSSTAKTPQKNQWVSLHSRTQSHGPETQPRAAMSRKPSFKQIPARSKSRDIQELRSRPQIKEEENHILRGNNN